MRVDPSTANIRPVVVAAILRDITFDPQVYKSFIDLQVRNLLCFLSAPSHGPSILYLLIHPY